VNKLKKLIIISFVILITGCGFEPILSNKGNTFSISKINLKGEEGINYLLASKLESYKKKDKNNNVYELSINTSSNRLVTSRDTKGNSKTFRYEVSVSVDVQKDNKLILGKVIKKDFSYTNLTNKFDLKKYEENIKKNLINEIFLDILNLLRSK
tara:strand:- start:201 stop:662 length:462 start_codon:yes stop_codon:yes gene_type:complete